MATINLNVGDSHEANGGQTLVFSWRDRLRVLVGRSLEVHIQQRVRITGVHPNHGARIELGKVTVQTQWTK